MFCGFEYYRLNQHWFFHKFLEKDPMKTYAKQIGIPRKFTNKHKGAWFIDFTQKPNYTTLTNKDQKLLDEQVNNMIDAKYTFYHMDGLNKTRLEKKVSYGSNVEFSYGNLVDIPFPDESFNLIWSNGVIHHTLDFNKCISEISRLLKPGGDLYI